MTGNKEAYFYLTSSLEKIFPDTDCVKENDQHTISIFKGELPAFLLVYGSSSNYDGDKKCFAEGFTYEIKGSRHLCVCVMWSLYLALFHVMSRRTSGI